MFTHNDPELKNGVRVYLARINDDVISRLESLTLNWMKMKRVMAMIILAKNQWIKKIKKQKGNHFWKKLKHPFLDSNGVLWVGGRLSRSKLTSNEAHPVVLPKTSSWWKGVDFEYPEKEWHLGT